MWMIAKKSSSMALFMVPSQLRMNKKNGEHTFDKVLASAMTDGVE